MAESCFKCSEINGCINITSSDASIIIKKNTSPYGVTFDVVTDKSEDILNLSFDSTERMLCLRDNVGEVMSCVYIPSDEPQTLSIDGYVLKLSNGGGEVILPSSPDLKVTSTSLNVKQSGDKNHNVAIEVVPSGDEGNILTFGKDNYLYVPNVAPCISSDIIDNVLQKTEDGCLYVSAENLLNTIKNSDNLKALFCSIVAECTPPSCNYPSDLQII